LCVCTGLVEKTESKPRNIRQPHHSDPLPNLTWRNSLPKLPLMALSLKRND
jgi:hypothetical protein